MEHSKNDVPVQNASVSLAPRSPTIAGRALLTVVPLNADVRHVNDKAKTESANRWLSDKCNIPGSQSRRPGIENSESIDLTYLMPISFLCP